MRRLALASLLLSLVGCSLVMDTSPPDPAYGSLVDASTPMPCQSPSDCDDANPCNGQETCGSNGLCAAGDPVVCPSDGCMVGHCKPDGSCEQLRVPSACDDGVECTMDKCLDDGACVHQLDDSACDDGIACTRDLCLGAALGSYTGGCYNLPQDSLCPQPTGVNGPCLAMACVPSRNDPNDESGCVVRPLGICETGMRCNFETARCEWLPDSCSAECDDGNPCNGVETCDPVEDVCVGAPGCGSTAADSCRQIVCSERDAAAACVEAPVYTSVCLLP